MLGQGSLSLGARLHNKVFAVDANDMRTTYLSPYGSTACVRYILFFYVFTMYITKILHVIDWVYHAFALKTTMVLGETPLLQKSSASYCEGRLPQMGNNFEISIAVF
jgi:hypothetical protein